MVTVRIINQLLLGALISACSSVQPLSQGHSSADMISVKGRVSKVEVRKELLRYESDIQYCYEKKLISLPQIKGKLIMEWAIDHEGRTKDIRVVDSEIQDRSIHSCLQSVIRKMSFTTANAKDEVNVRYPIEFVSEQL